MVAFLGLSSALLQSPIPELPGAVIAKTLKYRGDMDGDTRRPELTHSQERSRRERCAPSAITTEAVGAKTTPGSSCR